MNKGLRIKIAIQNRFLEANLGNSFGKTTTKIRKMKHDLLCFTVFFLIIQNDMKISFEVVQKWQKIKWFKLQLKYISDYDDGSA